MKLNEILDVDEVLPSSQTSTQLLVVEPPDVSPLANNTVRDDAHEARNNVRRLIAQGSVAITELLQVARDLKTPRTYEVVANMLQTLSDLNHDLLAVHQQEMTMVEPEAAPMGPVTIEQAVFVGSTSDLQEMIRLKREQKKRPTEVKG